MCTTLLLMPVIPTLIFNSIMIQVGDWLWFSSMAARSQQVTFQRWRFFSQTRGLKVTSCKFSRLPAFLVHINWHESKPSWWKGNRAQETCRNLKALTVWWWTILYFTDSEGGSSDDMNNQLFRHWLQFFSSLPAVPLSLMFLFQVWLLKPLWLHFPRRNSPAQCVSQCQLWTTSCESLSWLFTVGDTHLDTQRSW